MIKLKRKCVSSVSLIKITPDFSIASIISRIRSKLKLKISMIKIKSFS
jgi:hypothetical protein